MIFSRWFTKQNVLHIVLKKETAFGYGAHLITNKVGKIYCCSDLQIFLCLYMSNADVSSIQHIYSGSLVKTNEKL